jgi:hypothetical protein
MNRRERDNGLDVPGICEKHSMTVLAIENHIPYLGFLLMLIGEGDAKAQTAFSPWIGPQMEQARSDFVRRNDACNTSQIHPKSSLICSEAAE